MKKTKFFAFTALTAIIVTACRTSTPSNKAQEEAGGDSVPVAEATVVENQDADTPEPYIVDFSFENLLVLLKHYDDFELAETSGLKFIYEDGSQDEEIEWVSYAYGREVEQGEKEPFGYLMKATTPHGLYFTYTLDTSQHASLYFANEDDVKQFIEKLVKTEPTDFEDKTYYVHMQNLDDGQHLYIDLPNSDGDGYSTDYEIYPPQMENGFCRLDIGVYV